MGGIGSVHRRTLTTATILLAVGLAGSSCGVFRHTAAPAATPAAPVSPLSLALTPATNSRNLPVSTEIGLAPVNGTVTSVRVTTAGGAPVAGSFRDDGSTWIPAAPLAYASTYTAAVTAKSSINGDTRTESTTFTTMPQPGQQTGTGMYLFAGQTYGVAMPVVIEFDPPVPPAARAAVQKRLFVSSSPAQPGVWHWASGQQVWYRPPNYWQPGTTVTVRAGLAGVPMGGGYFGDVDRSATVRIGPRVEMLVDNASKSMSVYQNGRLTRTMPVSLGKPSTPSSSGRMVLMSHDYSTIFDTTREGPGGYRVQVYYAERLTWGGEFIHAAPWSVGEQGHDNVSHGCVNMSMDNSQWLYDITHIGDPITVQGTEVKLVDGNGWTAWNQSWADYIKGSALPVAPALAALGTPKASPTAGPTTSASAAAAAGAGAVGHPTPTHND